MVDWLVSTPAAEASQPAAFEINGYVSMLQGREGDVFAPSVVG